ncbi:hypothetical protein BH09VER1_BH09VER1_39940 [soil metagenome]
MKTMRSNLLAALFVFSCFSGCTAIRQSDAPMKENTLISAGFVARPADTAKKQADLASLTPFKIQMTTHKGKVLYLYPDPKNKVIYAGGRKAYAAYKKMALEQRAVAEKNMSDMEWNYWASTYGYGYAGNPSVIY